jgi:hypothetical protein
MKRWILNCLVAPLIFAACADKDSGPNPVVAPPTACINGSTYCDSSQYGYNQGFSAYPQNPYYTNGTNGNFCSCPAGQRPVYNGQFGLGCANITAMDGTAGSAIYWSWQSNNNQWVNMPQSSNTQGYFGNTTSCYKTVMQSCLVDEPNSCGAGVTCRVVGGGSRLGICTTGGTVPASPQASSPQATGSTFYR